jgi:hydrogenase expression/formation protein HypC
MCLAVPGKVIEISEANGLKMGRIDYGGTFNSVCLEYLPEVEIGQYVIVHAGFGISILDETEAKKTLALFDEMAEKNLADGRDIFGNVTDPARQDD